MTSTQYRIVCRRRPGKIVWYVMEGTAALASGSVRGANMTAAKAAAARKKRHLIGQQPTYPKTRAERQKQGETFRTKGAVCRECFPFTPSAFRPLFDSAYCDKCGKPAPCAKILLSSVSLSPIFGAIREA